MEKRALGAGGPMVSALGVGALSFSDFYGPVSEEQGHAILDAAREAGVTHIDTANVYGAGGAERIIGSYLKRFAPGAQPFTLATKASITRDPETGARCFDNSRAHLEAELDASLKRLGVEQVQLFYIHRRDPRLEIEEVAQTLKELIATGKIASFGFSEIAPASLRRAAAVHPVAAVQSEYSLSTRLPELGMVQACEALGTAMVAFSPIGRGLLTDTPPDADKLAISSFLAGNPRFTGGNLERNVAASAPFRALAAEMGVPAAALAIAWVLHRSPATIVIPGTRSVAHFNDLVAGTALPLDDDAMARIEAALPPGWAHGDRYSADQANGPENYC